MPSSSSGRGNKNPAMYSADGHRRGSMESPWWTILSDEEYTEVFRKFKASHPQIPEDDIWKQFRIYLKTPHYTYRPEEPNK